MSDDVLHRHVIIKLGGRICQLLIGNNQRGKKDDQERQTRLENTHTVENAAEPGKKQNKTTATDLRVSKKMSPDSHFTGAMMNTC